MQYRKFKHKIGNLYRNTVKTIVGWIPKNKNLILFSAWFGKKYADNSRYLFEYMLKNSRYDLYWFTKNEEVYKELKEKKIPVLYSKTWKAKWLQCRAVMLVSTIQMNDYNELLLNKCIMLDLDHGFPGKPGALMQPTVDDAWKEWYYFRRKGVKFYQTAASYWTVEYCSLSYDVPYSHYLFCNKPRVDVLFDKSLQQGVNTCVNEIKQNRRLITYLPTHRSCGRKKIPLNDVLELKEIQLFCEKTNSVFLIKKHFYHKDEVESLDEYPNIFDFTNRDLDTQVLLAQTDILVTDFSSCYIDFMPLDRPIVFYAYDYDEYLANERDYYWKYEKITAGYKTKNKHDFTKALESLSEDWQDTKHIEGRNRMKFNFFDKEVEMGTTREKLKNIIDQLINGTYQPVDWNSKK